MGRGSKRGPKARQFDSQSEMSPYCFQRSFNNIPVDMAPPSAQEEHPHDDHEQYAPSQRESFGVQIISISQPTDKSQGDVTQKTKMIRKEGGCRCKNDMCGNSYCGCVKQGLKCGISCECKNCKNHRYESKPMRCVFGQFWIKNWEYKFKSKKL